MRRGDDSARGFRLVRLKDLILEELRSLLRDDIEDPTLEGVGITELVLSVDARNARVHWGFGPDAAGRPPVREVERALVRATPFLRARLAEAIDLKRVPELRFVHDGGDP